MSRRYYSSAAAATTLSAPCTNVATTMVITAAVNLPSLPFTILVDPDTVNEEVVEVTNRSGTTLTVTRGVDGTTAVAHSAGAVVKHGISARDFDEPNAHVNTSSLHVPTQTGNGGKFLTTDGTTSSWAAVAAGGATLEPFFL